ncbi:MAG: exosortase/archaeosortase family protein [Candidatus Nanoarchaeia archaeon]|jgi:exosortase/archaeosortase family protein
MFDKQRKKFKRWHKHLSSRQKKLWTILKFLVIFNLMAVPLQLIIYFDINFYPLAFIERAQVSFFLNLFGVQHTLYDVPYQLGQLPAIDINHQILAIGEACTAIRSLIAFTALVLASPKSWKSKKKGLLLLPIVYLANIIRIITLAFVSLTNPSLFELVHVVLWREGLVLLIISLWVYWFNKTD